jgi:hypothetical protein
MSMKQRKKNNSKVNWKWDYVVRNDVIGMQKLIDSVVKNRHVKIEIELLTNTGTLLSVTTNPEPNLLNN